MVLTKQPNISSGSRGPADITHRSDSIQHTVSIAKQSRVRNTVKGTLFVLAAYSFGGKMYVRETIWVIGQL